MPLSKPAQVFLIGVVVAILSYGVGLFMIRNAESELRDARSECEKRDFYADLAEKYGGRIVCDPVELLKIENPARPSQGNAARLLAAYKALEERERWPLLAIAGIILGLAAIPWLWYFILRRVRELSKAVLGK
jgi:hypothetical protein